MDSNDADPTLIPLRKSSAERVRKHRKRQQKLETQVAFGVAKIVTGKSAGDQGKALLALLEKAARTRDLPEDVQHVIDEAIDKLRSRSIF
ncbi:hypothetical protein G6L37_05850 [Agrobacterium rubi]|nr:hypothetical protein [Agrobacterium rubi]NTF24883.1 hypothetical protein [Agrobacterium rubi]